MHRRDQSSAAPVRQKSIGVELRLELICGPGNRASWLLQEVDRTAIAPKTYARFLSKGSARQVTPSCVSVLPTSPILAANP